MAAMLLAVRDGIIPPTVNLTLPDPECDLDYTPQLAARQPVRTAMKLSLGFGGHLAAAVVRRISSS
jgi:3-oxoacyl-[acyl-carrier-protein] synthase II